MNSSQLILPILFQLSAFCPITDLSSSAFETTARAHNHHTHKPIPAAPDTSSYDRTAYTQCQGSVDHPLYNGGILKNPSFDQDLVGWSPFGSCSLKISTNGTNNYLIASSRTASYQGPSQSFNNLTQGLKYTISAWLQISGADSAIVKSTIKSSANAYTTAANVVAKSGCWSFLKGGFVADDNATSATLYFETANPKVDIWIDSVSLQPFTDDEWSAHQESSIQTHRKRMVSVSVTDCNGKAIKNAQIQVNQITGDFPFGSAIASTILDNPAYQKWFLERFNTAVFENEMKWYSTEQQRGKTSYATADRMLEFCKANNIYVRGHNVFWDDPQYQPNWVKGLGEYDLRFASYNRIQSVMSHYAGQVPQWDVLNEMLHFSFFESKLGKNTAQDFYKIAQHIDPKATLFLNDYNVIETPEDPLSSPDSYIRRLLEIRSAGVSSLGIGLEGHFSKQPNIVYMRAVLDKLSKLGMPIWLTEVDVMNSVAQANQAIYLHQVLREAFAHPAVKGIVLWTALHPYGCYRMCLTDSNFRNLPAGNTVDGFLRNIRTTDISGITDDRGSFNFHGFHGDYKISVTHNQTTMFKTMSIAADADVHGIHVRVG